MWGAWSLYDVKLEKGKNAIYECEWQSRMMQMFSVSQKYSRKEECKEKKWEIILMWNGEYEETNKNQEKNVNE